MKILTTAILASFLFTTAGCDRIAWEMYSYQTKERCAEWADPDGCYQRFMKLYELDGTRYDADGKKIPFERRYPG